MATEKITHDGLEVCTDCAMMIANAEGTEELAETIAQRWAGHGLVLSGGPEEESWFSWRECDGCGSTLGGDRLAAVAFGPDDDGYAGLLLLVCAPGLLLALVFTVKLLAMVAAASASVAS